MINTVIFDIGNVLVDFKTWEYLESYGYDDETNKRIAENTFRSKNWAEEDRGVLSHDELVELMSESCPDLKDKIDLLLTNLCESIHEYEYSAGLIDKLKDKGIKVFVLSNYGLDAFEESKNFLKFLKHIDGGVISCYEKTVKPEPEIYDAIIDRYNLKPEEALFFDDRLENIEAAQGKGINAVRVDNGYESIINGLSMYGIDISY